MQRLAGRHLRHGTQHRHAGQAAAPEGRAQPVRTGPDPHGVGRRLQGRRCRAVAGPGTSPPTRRPAAGASSGIAASTRRIAIGFAATVAVVLVLQAALFLWLASTNDTIGMRPARVAVAAAELSSALEADGLDVDAWLAREFTVVRTASSSCAAIASTGADRSTCRRSPGWRGSGCASPTRAPRRPRPAVRSSTAGRRRRAAAASPSAAVPARRRRRPDGRHRRRAAGADRPRSRRGRVRADVDRGRHGAAHRRHRGDGGPRLPPVHRRLRGLERRGSGRRRRDRRPGARGRRRRSGLAGPPLQSHGRRSRRPRAGAARRRPLAPPAARRRLARADDPADRDARLPRNPGAAGRGDGRGDSRPLSRHRHRGDAAPRGHHRRPRSRPLDGGGGSSSTKRCRSPASSIARSPGTRALDERGVALDRHIAAGAEAVLGDERRLEQVLQNLVANAAACRRAAGASRCGQCRPATRSC